MSDDLRQVLNYIVARYVVDDEFRTIDRDAPVVSTTDSDSEKQQAARRESVRAEHLAEAFEQGLIRAWQRAAMGGSELPLDDRKPEEDRMADALIRFLVRYDLATSRTESTSESTYTYYLSIHWDRLGDVALASGVDLTRVLPRLAERLSH